MLKREFKLKSSAEVKEVLRAGRRYRGHFLTLFVLAGTNEHSRAAVIVGGKVASSAVIRNRVRRLIFTNLEGRFNAWENRPVSDMVVMVMTIPFDTTQSKLDEKQLLADLDQCFARL